VVHFDEAIEKPKNKRNEGELQSAMLEEEWCPLLTTTISDDKS